MEATENLSDSNGGARFSAVEEIEYDSVPIPEVGVVDSKWKKFKRFLVFLGPGFLVAMGYLDPGNMEGDLAIGGIRNDSFDPSKGGKDASGYMLLWLVLLAHLGGLLFQILASRLGNVTGYDLATLCRMEYSKRVNWTLWGLIEIAIIGADFQAVIGTAVALRLLFGIPTWIGVLMTLLEAFFFLGIQVFGVRKLELLFAFLIGVMSTCFFINGVVSKPHPMYIISGLLIPRIPKKQLGKAIGIIGCIIMPHNLFLHSSLVQSRAVKRTSEPAVREANYFYSVEAALTLSIAFCVNAAVVCTFAHPGLVVPPGQEDFSLETGYLALKEAFSSGAASIWAIGLLAAGQNATMAGTYAGQFVMQGFLNLQISPFARIIAARLITLVPLTAICVLSESYLDLIAESINVMQAMVLPFTLIPLLKLSASRTAMGQFMISPAWLIVSYTLALVVVVCNLLFAAFTATSANLGVWSKILAFVIAVAYTLFCHHLLRKKLGGYYCLADASPGASDMPGMILGRRDEKGLTIFDSFTDVGSPVERGVSPALEPLSPSVFSPSARSPKREE